PCASFDCSKQEDGIYELSCQSYVVCNSSESTLVHCPAGGTFVNATGRCGSYSDASYPCNVIKDCTTLPDGRYADINNGCQSYYRCYNNPKNVAPPCGLVKNCVGVADGRYADKSLGCHSYYTCEKDVYFGHNLCTNGLVFDEVLQTCNWPQNVSPPCGTKTA
ncbi:hypothetical protein KUTeg_010363, partial [Tegillarca granosa]